jgi:tetratricopeptide (TPR) repeat protein
MRESFTLLQATGRRADTADAFSNFGMLLFYQGKFAEAHALGEEGASLANDLGFRRPAIIANNLLSQEKLHLGQYDQADELGQSSLSMAQEIGDQELIGVALSVLGEVALAQARDLEAQQLLQKSSTIFRELGYQDNLSTTLAVLGIADCRLGMVSQAQQYLGDVLRRATEGQPITTLPFLLPALAVLLIAQDEKERAVELYALVSSNFPFVANSRWFEEVVGRGIAAVAATLSSAVVAAAKARGQAGEPWTTAKELLAEVAEGS